jgi:frataxin-like iron-binding protein CyaY
VHDDELDPDDELADLTGEHDLSEDEELLSDEDYNGHVLSIRRADGTEVVTLSTLASGQPWAVHMQPGGAIQNAYVGPQDTPHVWVNADAYEISRDEDGTYVIRID